MANDFVTWLMEELNKRSWRDSELARQAGIATATVSLIMSGKRKPGPDVCVSIATALGLSPELVFRRAGLLPPLPPEVEEGREADYIVRGLSPELQTVALNILRAISGQILYPYAPPATKAIAEDESSGDDLEKLSKLWELAPDHIKPAIVQMITDEVMLYLDQPPNWGPPQAEHDSDDDIATGQSL